MTLDAGIAPRMLRTMSRIFRIHLLIGLLGGLMLSSCSLRPPSPPPKQGIEWYEWRGGPLERRAREPRELDEIAHKVAAQCGRRLSAPVEISRWSRGPLASITYHGGGDRITVNPRAAKEVPLNSWAFIFGHELAHQVENFGRRGHTDPQQELRADIMGAEYATRAGYQLLPYLKWMLASSPMATSSHGDMHWRAREMGKHFGIADKL